MQEVIREIVYPAVTAGYRPRPRGVSEEKGLQQLKSLCVAYRSCGLQVLVAYEQSIDSLHVWAGLVCLDTLRHAIRIITGRYLDLRTREGIDAWFSLSRTERGLAERALMLTPTFWRDP